MLRLQSLGPADPGLAAGDRLVLTAYLWWHAGALEGASGQARGGVVLDVEPGQSAADVAATLNSLEVVEAPGVFVRYLRYRGLDTGIEAGRYQVSGEMRFAELADLLQEARDSRYTLVVPEGWRREEVARAVGALGLAVSPGDFLQASRVPPPGWAEPPPAADDLEGFLFPDSYRLDPTLTAAEIVDGMVENFERQVDAELRSGFNRHGLTPYQAVVLASIVERETAVPDERPRIAAVFLNRLALGIPLQADPTVQYALGLQPDGGWWIDGLSAEDLQIDSPYNTYRYGGLPPTPIANPGLDALHSVAFPADSQELFFRAACDGSGRHRFAVTFEEHLQNACP